LTEEVAAELVSEISLDVDAEKATPRMVALLFFDYANLTGDGKLNLAGVFDRLFVDRETKKTVPIGIFIRVAETVGSTVFVTIHSPDKKVAAGFAFAVPSENVELKDARREGEKHLMFQMLARVQFDAPAEGTYWVNVGFDGKSIGGCPLVIEFRDANEMQEITRGDA